MSSITTHILDISLGKPAQSVKVELFYLKEEILHKIAESYTDKDGRIKNWLSNDLVSGFYKIRFHTLEYFKTNNKKSLYPEVEITFEVENPREHFHIPLLLSSFGFSTYRGS